MIAIFTHLANLNNLNTVIILKREIFIPAYIYIYTHTPITYIVSYTPIIYIYTLIIYIYYTYNIYMHIYINLYI